MALLDLREVERESVQSHPDAKKNEAPADFWMGTTARTELLSPYASAQRKKDLLAYYRHPLNGMVQSAFAGMTKKWSGVEWVLKGERKREYFNSVLNAAHFGEGWETFTEMVGLDFLRFDDGAYIELIYPGSPLKAPTGALAGIAHLNNLRCVPTGDPEFPVLYVDRKHKKHLLHHTRVIHLVDAPDGDDSYPGYGLCALSRAISIVTQQLLMNGYINSKLDNNPPPGFVVASNINKAQRDVAINAYRAETGGDTLPVTGQTIWFYSVDPTNPAKIEVVTFAQAPENWSYEEYTQIHVNALALAMGVDVQEIWQLMGGTLGSGQQSMVLHAKSENKTFGAFLKKARPKFDNSLPSFSNFAYVVRDPYAVQDEALAMQGWSGGIATVGPDVLSPDEKRQILANQIPAVRDVIGTPSGGVTPAPEPVLQENGLEGDAPGKLPGSTGPRADAENPRRLAKPERTQGERKELEDTKAEDVPETPRSALEREFKALLEAAAAGTMTEVALRLLLRDLLQRYGVAAYQRALSELGREDMDAADHSAALLLLASLAPFVRSFAKEVMSAPMDSLALALASRADLWWNKSIQPFIDEARYKAAPNTRYTFVGDDGAESCADCQRLKNLSRPMWWWKATRQRPRTDTDNFECGGFHCNHTLTPAAEAA